jgi:glutamate synthase domain-containing protein 2/glutamate synthase domain-containing protein 1/glutamate synthase domain-containing protein 3
MPMPTTPTGADGLYDPRYEHDACGVAFVARLDGRATHKVVRRAVTVVENLEHRGATGSDPTTGDGAGILMQMPDALLRDTVDFELPARGRYGVAMCFLPRHRVQRADVKQFIEAVVAAEGQQPLGWRRVPVDETAAGTSARAAAPIVEQLFIGLDDGLGDELAAERKLYVIRRLIEKTVVEDLHIASMSSRTLVYKGMLIAHQLAQFFADLHDERTASALGLVHSRFSTNTFPSWPLAHPYRFIAHNGEINALMGNRNWMRARESSLRSDLFGDDLEKLAPIVQAGNSDSATFDNVLELLHLGGRSLPHALMMMIPEAYEGREEFVTEEVRGFYEFHSCLMEPWDGPAVIAATDGHVIGATLDRNGLRPGRWMETRDGHVVLASETGALPMPESEIVRKGRLQPGKLFLVDLDRHRIVDDADIKQEIATQQPYGEWFRECSVRFEDLPEKAPRSPRTEPLRTRQLAFGYSQEDLRVLLAPMAAEGAEPTGSMGNDLALAVLSDRSPSLFSYFKQLFAQVTNPAIDPIREKVVMSLSTGIGSELNLLDESPAHAHQLVMSQPILRNSELEKLRQVSHEIFRAETIDITWPIDDGPKGMARAVERICAEASYAIDRGANILILSDREVSKDRVPIPSLLAVSAVHNDLVRAGTRLRAGLVIESGEPREVHHMACLIGYGASAINPYLMFESLWELRGRRKLPEGMTAAEAEREVVKAIGKGLLKVLSKMGISTIQSYCGAQIFEAVGLHPNLVDEHFTGTPSRIGGVGLGELAREALDRHARGYPRAKAAPPPEDEAADGPILPVGGVYMWRRGGERHMWDPETVTRLQQVARTNGDDPEDAQAKYERFATLVNEENATKGMLRGLLELRGDVEPIPIDDVEPAKEIVKRFSTGGMSLGALSPESHEGLAQAMNRLGGKSNTGEGGEDPRRFADDRRSSIKQVASGRFGVTIEYLVNSDELQIKVAQGAKPGEGGQLPGHKVDRYIASLRHSTPGVGLISPPPHHDIYSIEDLKQLIYDLRCANPRARVSVKLVSEIGVGTVAAGVAKANADHVVIAGHDGGTGASPKSSIQHAGVPWEIGLAETQQTLMRNDLRSRIIVQTDGQMRTGRDVIVAALLGADEYGFSTAPLIAQGCIMMRVCHLNTCPVGIATQDPELRARFRGKPEHVVNYLFLVAEEVRRILASLGLRRLEDAIGRADLLVPDGAVTHWKAKGIDLSELLVVPDVPPGTARRRTRGPDPVLGDHLDHELIEACAPALARAEPVELSRPIRNVHRTVGGLLSSAIARERGAAGLPPDTIRVDFHGSAGQSFAAWLAPGVSFTLWGDANDYTAKGMSGGTLAVRPAPDAGFVAEENVVVGNTVLYGATSGKAFFRGLAGERFAVRNSGVSAVVEGVGDHGCEYMTGGRVVVLGPTGLNFAAGMSGGIAYVLDPYGRLADRCNTELVDLEAVDEADAIELRELIAEHGERTGSSVAARVLETFDTLLPSFVKVFPRDYKRALAELSEADGKGDEGADVVLPTAPAPAK